MAAKKRKEMRKVKELAPKQGRKCGGSCDILRERHALSPSESELLSFKLENCPKVKKR